MLRKRVLILAAVAALSGATVPAIAAQMGEMSMGEMKQHQGMMGGQGMMGCGMMSGGMGGAGGGGVGAMMGGRGMPAFPAGNEKLQLQMHAEIMQKVGEIMARYAAQLPSR